MPASYIIYPSDSTIQMPAPHIIYPSNSTIQMPLNEPDLHIHAYRGLSRIKSEKVNVKNVPLPVEQMITETRPSQIETIDLPPISSKLEQLPEVDKESILSSNIAQVKHIHIIEKKVNTATASDFFETQTKQSGNSTKKYKKAQEIHVNIRQRPK